MMDCQTAPPVRLAIVGHVDHGKSTLVGRLLVDTASVPASVLGRIRATSRDAGSPQLEFLADNLAEERRDAKTIDTTQVFLNSRSRSFVIIDTPGHAEFVKNMFTGASRADAALLLVDAVEGIREQTMAHTHILALLGVRHVVPVVNKMDKVGFAEDRFRTLAESTAAHLARLGVVAHAAVPLSALGGDNVSAHSSRLPWYHGPSLLDVLAALPATVMPTGRPLRFAVQGIIEVEGERVLVGRVEAGRLCTGDAVCSLPAGHECSVTAIRVFQTHTALADAGMCVGVQLSSRDQGCRGVILSAPEHLPAVSDSLYVRLIWLDEQPLRCGETLVVRIATQDVDARVEAITEAFSSRTPEQIRPRTDHLGHGEIGLVCLRAKSPVVFEPFSAENALGTVALAREGNICGAGTIPDGL